MTPKQSLMMTRIMAVVPDISTLKMRLHDDDDFMQGLPPGQDYVYFSFELPGYGKIKGRISHLGEGGSFSRPGHATVSHGGDSLQDIIGCPPGCMSGIVSNEAFFSFYTANQFVTAADIAMSAKATRKTDISTSLINSTTPGIEQPFQKRYMRVIKNRNLV